MSKSRWQSSRSHTPEPTMEANPPLRVNDSRGVCREEPGQAPLLSDGSRGRVQSRRKWEQPARMRYLGIGAPIVKGFGNVFRESFSPGPWPKGHNPARIRRHSDVVNGVVTIRGKYGYDEPPKGDASQDLISFHLTCKAADDCGLVETGKPGGRGNFSPSAHSLASPGTANRLG